MYDSGGKIIYTRWHKGPEAQRLKGARAHEILTLRIHKVYEFYKMVKIIILLALVGFFPPADQP